MANIINPFITYGYESPEYFCDRKKETAQLVRLLTNGNNVALISPRRMGKTGLIHHCFVNEEISKHYVTFLIDIYATKNLADLVWKMGRAIVSKLRPWGQKAVDNFLKIVTSLRTGISFDGNGNASWNVDIGDIKKPEFTLEEIFSYLQTSTKPCIVAIDEFQTIASYPESNIEALLRTYVQECRNAVFVFSGSQRRMMNEMFSSPARPFYQSVTMMNISSIPEQEYDAFATSHFERGNKHIDSGVLSEVYNRFDATTWYIQKMLNELYSVTPQGGTCRVEDIDEALNSILSSYEATYQDILVQLSSKQVNILKAICRERSVAHLTASSFIKKYHLDSASSVQKATKVLLDKQIITRNIDCYEPYDKFMAIWLREN